MASRTTWIPEPDEREWLLTDGRRVPSPPLEHSVTPSGSRGLKVRNPDTGISGSSKRPHEVIARALEQIHGTPVWMLYREPKPYDLPPPERVRLHLLGKNPGHYGKRTTLWWRFRHPDLPLYGEIHVDLASSGYNRSLRMTTQLRCSTTGPWDWDEPSLVTSFTNHYHERGLELNLGTLPDWDYDTGNVERNRYDTAVKKLHQQLDDHPPEWFNEIDFGLKEYDEDAAAIKDLALKCRVLNSLAAITIPDLRDPANPGWIEVEALESNVGSELMTTLGDFLDNDSAVADIVGHYEGMRQAFHRLGLVMPERSRYDFHAGLSGDDEVWTVNLAPVQDVNGHDHLHAVSWHLLTGTITVACGMRDNRPEDVAQAYEVARLKAEILGEEENFRNFESIEFDTAAKQRLSDIIARRKQQQDGLA